MNYRIPRGEGYHYRSGSRLNNPVYYDRRSYFLPGRPSTLATPVLLFPPRPLPPPVDHWTTPGDSRYVTFGGYPFVPVQRSAQFIRPAPTAISRDLTDEELKRVVDNLQSSDSQYTSMIINGDQSSRAASLIIPGPPQNQDVIVSSPRKPQKWRVTEGKLIVPVIEERIH